MDKETEIIEKARAKYDIDFESTHAVAAREVDEQLTQ